MDYLHGPRAFPRIGSTRCSSRPAVPTAVVELHTREEEVVVLHVQSDYLASGSKKNPECVAVITTGRREIVRATRPQGVSSTGQNGWNTVNFFHGIGVGPFIFLVQAEILVQIRKLTRGDLASVYRWSARPTEPL
ncbi:hypothetical protein [Streptomyces niveus]|uniref:hypothetical protein n=1 Tax=Streptomyces niveus TaxID=193462 RepID=UPI003865DA1E